MDVTLWALALAALFLLVAGCSGPSHFEVNRDAITIDPHTFEEVNLHLKAGESFQYNWFSSGTVYFNIHSHRDGTEIEWIQRSATSFAGTFTADIDGGYSLLWENQGNQHLAVTYHAGGAGAIDNG